MTNRANIWLLPKRRVEMLEEIEAPLAVVSIAGLWRTGKSYLLNHFSGAHEKADGGFQVGATVNACTKGLWLWGTPVKLEDGLTVLFVDTEGLGSTSRTQTEDSQIFSLALLLSSMFVWNSRGVIDGNALEDFALVVNLTKHIHVRSNAASKAVAKGEAPAPAASEKGKPRFVASGGGLSSSGGGGGGGHELEALAEHFPSFMWVVRDFTLRLEDGGRKINDRQYLENALKPQQSFTSEAASRNQIRTLLSSFFRERDCVTLVRPAEDEATLRNLKNVPLEQLRPEFQAGLKTLKSKLYAALRPKAVNGRALTGAMLGTLAQTYVEALNSGGVPTISTAWDRVLQSQAAEAVAKAIDAYDKRATTDALGAAADLAKKLLASKTTPRPSDDSGERRDDDGSVAWSVEEVTGLPIEQEALRSIHEAAALEAEGVFAKAVWGDADEDDASARSGRDESAAMLEKALRGRRKRLEELNDACSTAHCARLLDDLFDSVFVVAKTDDDDATRTKGGSYSDSAKERLARVGDDDVAAREKEYLSDLRERREWLDDFRVRYETFLDAYADRAKGPAKWDVFAELARDRILGAFLEWATELGVRHRAMAKLARSELASLDEKQQTVAGKVTASKSGSKRELEALERAANESDVNAKAAVEALEHRIETRKTELQRHSASTERLAGAYEFATDLLEKQAALQKELIDDLKHSLSTIRRAANATRSDDADEDGNGTRADDPSAMGSWDAADLGFEQEEMAEFAPLSMAELKERIAEDEKELELMHEHAALTIEHAKVKKMLLADKDHELQEYEYQWGVAKANVAASEGELMVVDEEVAVLRGTVVQMHRYLEGTSRTGKLPNDVYRALSREQRALLDSLLSA
ncbi:hypothetical protein CTAYLR_000747 [Chrysophaeum taylorii]|uniref:GB1/RHD3-type G domain-containing protein n=1 Tax=Chrysophaeum taylorii TaxID=2483200 RepID=A0AAD7UQW6_9STRA|nr:hypothetical protein CTAYLR_000747 [Chrysophaeum taylorii]